MGGRLSLFVGLERLRHCKLVGHASRIRERVFSCPCVRHKLSEYRDAKRGFRNESNDRREWQPCPTIFEQGETIEEVAS